MSDSKDITARVHAAFLQEILNNPSYSELEIPLRSLLASESTMKPEGLIKIYELTNVNQLPESK